MDPVLCPKSQHDITDWVNHGMGKKMKLQYLQDGT